MIIVFCYLLLAVNAGSYQNFIKNRGKTEKFGKCKSDDECQSGLLCLDAVTGFTCRDPKDKAAVGHMCGQFQSPEKSIILECESDMYCEVSCYDTLKPGEACKNKISRCTKYGKFGETCDNKYSKCRPGLICESSKCTIEWDSNLDGLAKNFTDDYTATFEHRVQNNVSYNIRVLSSPMLDGHSAPGVIPDTDEDKQGEITNELNLSFGDYCISMFPTIVKEAIKELVGQFFSDNNLVGLTESELNTKKEQLTKTLQVEVQIKLDKFVDAEWEKYKETAAEDVSVKEEEFLGTVNGLEKRKCCQKLVRFFKEDVKDFFVDIGKDFAEFVVDGVKAVLSLKDGIKEFVTALINRDYVGAFKALGKAFVDYFFQTIEKYTHMRDGPFFTKFLRPIGDVIVKVVKTIITMDPKVWALILISLVIGAALSVIFPPLAVGLLGYAGVAITNIIATGIVLVVEGAIFALQFKYLDPLIQEKMYGDSLEYPDTITLEDGTVMTYDKKRKEYCQELEGQRICTDEETQFNCFVEEGKPDICPELDPARGQYCYPEEDDVRQCLIESEEQYCAVIDDFYVECIANDNRTYVILEGKKSYYNETTDTFEPPLPYTFVDGNKMLYDEGRGEYCRIDEYLQRLCLNEDGDLCSIAEKAEENICADNSGIYSIIEGEKWYYDKAIDDFIPKSEYIAKYGTDGDTSGVLMRRNV